MQVNSENTISLSQDCHELISQFILKNKNGNLNAMNLERVSQEVTEKVTTVMRNIYDIFNSMHNVLHRDEYESDFLLANTETAYLTFSEINLINEVAQHVFHGTVKVANKEPVSDMDYFYKRSGSIFHEEIFNMALRSECTIKCTMSPDRNQILKPHNIPVAKL